MKLFLDIDGVMVHANPSKKVEFEEDGFFKFNENAINAINSINSSYIEIILSTTHRHRYSISKWTKIFHRRGIKFNKLSIVDIKPAYNISRRMEIEKWISHKKYKIEEIIIIDDDKSLNGLPEILKSRLILTNSYTGINSPSEIKHFLRNKNNL